MVTTTDTQAALLAAIAVSPDEDSVRLAYADWLDENADKPVACGGCAFLKPNATLREDCPACNGAGKVPDTSRADRAEFIRVHVELARMPPMGPKQFDPRYMLPMPWEGLRRREKALLDANPEWKPACPACKGEGIPPGLGIYDAVPCKLCSGSGRAPCVVWRGFVEEVTVPTMGAVLEQVDCPERRPPNADVGPRLDQYKPHQYCPRCKGERKVLQATRYARSLFADAVLRAGLRRVGVADRVPEAWHEAFAWYRDSQPWTPRPLMELPGIVFDALKGGNLHESGHARDYPTSALATLAASTAVCDVLRGMAATHHVA